MSDQEPLDEVDELLGLTHVADEDGYTHYEDESGNDVYLQDDTGKPLVPFSEVDWQSEAEGMTAADALDHLRDMVIDPDSVDDELYVCYDCDGLSWRDDATHTQNGDDVCEDCISNSYVYCEHCEEWANDYSHAYHGGVTVCDSCIGNYYSYCDDCDTYVSDDDYDHQYEHESDSTCDCEAPAQSFRVRHGADNGYIVQDEQVTVSLPSGVISDTGAAAIADLIRQHGYAVLEDSAAEGDDNARADRYYKWRTLARNYKADDAVGLTWQTKDGNFTKRLSRYAYKNYGLKVPAEIVSAIGNLARQHSQGSDWNVAYTRDLNMPAEEYAHEDSCWFTDYAAKSRCALKSNGGMALRTFGEVKNYWGETVHTVTGRAWVMPVVADDTGRLRPTFDTEAPDALLTFNGYGDLEGYAAARIVAQQYGMTYRKVTDLSIGEMYINDSRGYLVAPEELASKLTDRSIRVRADQHADLYHEEQMAGPRILATV